MSWSDRFIGIPFADFGRDRQGCDCWGLACIIYRDELRITLPDYLGDYASADEQAEILALISRDKVSPLWQPVSGPAAAFDLALFRRGRLATHIGVVIRHGLMIHMVGEDCAKVQGYLDGPYKHRLIGIFRHVERSGPVLCEALR